MIRLSKTSKMPCPSYSLPISNCKVGSKLAKIPNTVCNRCYAMRGYYSTPNVKAAMHRRLGEIILPNWVQEMCEAIEPYRYFRWHDSGDLQSTEHFNRIISIANNLPHTKFWLPTKEKQLLSQVLYSTPKPNNLIIRLSSVKVDHLDNLPFNLTSYGVLQSVSSKLPISGTFRCQAKSNCGMCRACWDQSFSVINYKLR